MEEQQLRDGGAVYIKSLFSINQGTAYLTTKRFMFGKRSGLFNAVTGPLFMHLKKGGKVVFEMEFTNLKSIVKGKHGLGSKYIFTNSIGEEYAVQFNSFKDGQESWLNAICQAAEKSGNNIKPIRSGDNIVFETLKAGESNTNEENGGERPQVMAGDKLQKLKEVKDLLDSGVITQIEFDKLKAEIIN